MNDDFTSIRHLKISRIFTIINSWEPLSNVVDEIVIKNSEFFTFAKLYYFKDSENEFRSETLDLLCKMMNSKNEIPMIALIIKFILLTH